MIVGVGIACIARFQTWTSKRPLHTAAVLKAGWAPLSSAAVAFAILSALAAAWYALRSPRSPFSHEIGARHIQHGVSTDPVAVRALSMIEPLSIGMGVDPPFVTVLEHPAPNASTVGHGRTGTIVITTGLLALPRQQCEGVLAHAMARCFETDVRYMYAAERGALLSQRVAASVLGASTLSLLIALEVLDKSSDTIPASWLGASLAMTAISGGVVFGMRWIRGRLQRESTLAADVAAIRLARNPAAFAAACLRLDADQQDVSHKTTDTPAPDALNNRRRLAWFEALSGTEFNDGKSQSDTAIGFMKNVSRTAANATELLAEGRGLHTRAIVAYREAHVPFPTPAELASTEAD